MRDADDVVEGTYGKGIVDSMYFLAIKSFDMPILSQYHVAQSM